MGESKNHLVFVYGTLKRGEPNQHFMSKSTFLTEGTTVQKLPLVIASAYNVPFLIDCPGMGKNVKGEVYSVDDESLQHLDVLEDHPLLYVRELRDVETQKGEVIQCWIYVLKKYKAEMLDLPFLESYSSEGDHGKRYVASEDDLHNPDDI